MTRTQMEALAKRLHHEALYGHSGVAGVELRLREAMAEELQLIANFFKMAAERGEQPTLREVADEIARRSLEFVPWKDEE
jgi:hypothetical protein